MRQRLIILTMFVWGAFALPLVVVANNDSINVPSSWVDPLKDITDTTTQAVIPPSWDDPYLIKVDTVNPGDIPPSWIDPYTSDTTHTQPDIPQPWEDPYIIKYYSLTVCDNPYTFMGKEYPAPGMYRERVETEGAYDIVYVLQLTLLDKYLFVQKNTIDEGQTYMWRGKKYNKSGIYSDVFTTTTGCDSIYQLHLEVIANPCKMPVWVAPIKAKTDIKQYK